MKKVIMFIAGICCFGLLIAALIVSLTSLTAEEEETIVSAEEAESYEAELIKEKEALYPRPTYDDTQYMSVTELAYAKATEEQKKQLDGIDKAFGGVGEYERQVMIIMGDLPADTPYLTLEKAREICASFDTEKLSKLGYGEWENAVREEFNKVAGAPDFIGGSGITTTKYYTDETHENYIFICLGEVGYHKSGSKDAEVLFEW